MDCHAARSTLTDAPAPPGGRRALLAAAAHAGGCAACAQFADDLGRIEAAFGVASDDTIEPPAGGYDALACRLAPMPRQPAGAAPLRWFAAAATVAVAALAGYGIGRSATSGSRVAVERAGIGSAEFDLSPAERRESAKAFTAVSAAFDRRADWVWTGDSAADVGVGTTVAGAADRVVLIKLVLRHDGRVVSRGELAVVAGREAELRLPLAGGRETRYRVAAPPARNERVDVAVRLHELNDDTPLAILAASVSPRDGRAARLGLMNTSDGDYELIAGVSAGEEARP